MQILLLSFRYPFIRTNVNLHEDLDICVLSLSFVSENFENQLENVKLIVVVSNIK